MSKKCFKCQKTFTEEEFAKHELECNSHYFENEMENLIPCDICNNLIPFEEYENHINFCGLEQPIYIPLNIPLNFSSNTSPNPESLQNFINETNSLINLLNSISPPDIEDEYEELSQLDEDNNKKHIQDLKNISKIIKTKEEFNCPICFDTFKIDEEIRQLNCNHMMCIECSSDWFQENVKCPICMKEFEENT